MLAPDDGLTYRNAKELGISYHVYSKIKHGFTSTKKQWADRLTLETQDQVREFWYTSSRELPCKKNKLMFVANTTDGKLERHYFEARHDKNAADGLSAVLMYGATKAVTHQKSNIRDACEFVTFCLDNLQEVGTGPPPSQQHSARKFLYVDSIHREKVPAKSIKGTMTIHAVQSLCDPKVILKQEMSCFCMAECWWILWECILCQRMASPGDATRPSTTSEPSW